MTPLRMITTAPSLVMAFETPKNDRAWRTPRPIKIYVRKMPNIYTPARRMTSLRVLLRLSRKPRVRSRTDMAQGLMLSNNAASVTTGRVSDMRVEYIPKTAAYGSRGWNQ